LKIDSNSSNKLKSTSEKGKRVLALSVVVALTFAVAALAALMTFHSGTFVVAVAQQSPGNDPMNCFRSNVTISTCPMNPNIVLHNDTMDCFKTIGETKVGSGNTQNYTKSVQNFVSLIPTAKKITLINENIVGGKGPVTNMTGVWDVMKNANMTRYDRQLVLDDINNLLASVKPEFTKIQHDALSLCITTELNSLGPTANY
jgi:hypothetical protein